MGGYGEVETLREAFDIQPAEVISLVGAGGKTTLMFALARELMARKGVVITTTTTKIYPPSLSDTPYVLVSEDGGEIRDFILASGERYGHITIVSERIASSGKLRGISTGLVNVLKNLKLVNYVIIEADGAAKRPLKAPNIAYEPVIPADTSLVIPVVGVDVLGHELQDEFVFRAEIAARLTGTKMGEIVSSDMIAILMTHPSGIIYGSPVHARVVPFINKVDFNDSLSDARILASRILEAQHPQIDRVVLGQAKFRPPVLEVLYGRHF